MTNHPATSSSQAVLILGMHRSGTSCLAGSLQEAGLYLGEVNTAARSQHCCSAQCQGES